ncbi:DUF2163 domain-containing protein [Aliigemmobacter aestuarii]|uniref:DUF2163 domain-containing protein n=1 Tax=Aliigemmobacter aestuarii TaxID=1445661 RepID=A0A4S3MQR6_9RHOB|nr:DUF2163 domain-containing protein [Gemmobacter aestuarii]THD84353.1 DUF2163 domain-containing protein [Gemmobacter aestuarii]
MSWDLLDDHLKSGTTTLCRAWRIARRDGTVFGFTDHDRDLKFEGTVFRAETGVSGRAIAQVTGLAVNNTEVLGALMSEALEERDILAGRFDGAEVRCWLVNWARPLERVILFRGHVGEIVREGEAFRAEFRGLAEALNVPDGRAYQTDCGAVLGDGACGVDLTRPAFSAVVEIASIVDGRFLTLRDGPEHEDRWFERGRLEVLDGAAAGVTAVVKGDRRQGRLRTVELWQDVVADLRAGDRVRLTAGCDKRADTCRAKFANFLNFRGFPHIPGEDWLTTFPSINGVNDGGGVRP